MKITERQRLHLQSMEDTRGRLTPSRVVQDAKRKSSPLHALFNWDKDVAAQRYWLDRARRIIAAVHLVHKNETTTIKTPVYVRDPDAKGEGYRSVTALKAEPTSARESLIYTLDVAAGHVRRALDLADPLGLSAEVDHLLAEIVGVQRIAMGKAAA